MLDQLTTIPTDAGAGFLAGAAAEIQQQDIKGHPFMFNPITDKLHDLEPLLPAPLRQKTDRRLETIEDFCSYVNRFKKPDTTIYATGLTIVAEIDHRSSNDLVWGDHRATVSLSLSESLQKWKASNKRPITQEDFAELLEDRALEVILPPAADILELVQELHVTKASSVTSAIRSNGRHSLSFNSTQGVKGGSQSSVDLPTSFEIRITPFHMQDITTEIRALLRVRVREDHPVFIFDFQKLDERVSEAFAEILADIKEVTSLPVYR